MSNLNPKGIPIVLGGVERKLLFTLNVMDEIQSHYEKTVFEVLGLLGDANTQTRAVRYLLMVLLNDEAEREKFRNKDTDLKVLSEKEVGWLVSYDNLAEVVSAIIRAYGISMPEPDEDEVRDPNGMSSQNN